MAVSIFSQLRTCTSVRLITRKGTPKGNYPELSHLPAFLQHRSTANPYCMPWNEFAETIYSYNKVIFSTICSPTCPIATLCYLSSRLLFSYEGSPSHTFYVVKLVTIVGHKERHFSSALNFLLFYSLFLPNHIILRLSELFCLQ